MILVDTNLLIYATDAESPHHGAARRWMEDRLNGPAGVGLPWQSLSGFVRITSNPRIFPKPMGVEQAWDLVREWLGLDSTFVPEPTPRHAEILTRLMPFVTRAELVPDAHLAALAMEYGLVLCSTDADFDRFPDLAWRNPIAGSP